MDYYKVPIGFGETLSMNPFALNVYSTMTEEQKLEILKLAHNAHSKEEMQIIVNSIRK